MTIKHLVISGGGPIMVLVLGAIQHLEQNNFVDMKNIESIYGTSAGAIVGVLICLKYDWETINEYTKKGVYDIKTIEKCFKPLLDAKDIPMDINLENFYNLTKIELHLFSFEINEYKAHDISYLTHPNLSLMLAIQMTCALPVLVTPVCIDDKCYIDGGMSCNYPLNFCITSGKIPDEILGFKNKYSDKKDSINLESTLLDFLLSFLFKAVLSVNTDHSQPQIKNEVICDVQYLTFNVLRNALSNMETRRELFKNGTETADTFLSSLKDCVQELSESLL